jgi:hypothetical protein
MGRFSITKPIAAANGGNQMTRERSPLWVRFTLALLAFGAITYLVVFYAIEYLMTFF